MKFCDKAGSPQHYPPGRMILFRCSTLNPEYTPRIAQNRTYPPPIVGRSTGATPRPSNRRCAARCSLRTNPASPQRHGLDGCRHGSDAMKPPSRHGILHRNLGQSRLHWSQVCAHSSRSPDAFPVHDPASELGAIAPSPDAGLRPLIALIDARCRATNVPDPPPESRTNRGGTGPFPVASSRPLMALVTPLPDAPRPPETA